MSVDKNGKDTSAPRREGGAPKNEGPAAGAARSRRGALVVIAGALALALIILLVLARKGPPPEPQDTAAAAPRPASSEKRRPAGERPGRPEPRDVRPPEPDPDSIEGTQDPQERRRRRAAHAHEAYREYAKYPPVSRPMREHPDQVKPHYVAPNKLPLARSDQKLTDAMVALSQDRFFVVGDERVVLTIACETSDGPAACEVLSASAFVPTHAPARAEGAELPPPAPIVFGDAGEDGDAAAGDGTMTALLAPSAQGFQSYYGPIQVDIDLRVEGETGRAMFDIVYTPKAPAIFTGKFREVIEDGSLSLYAEMQVDKPGRYVLAARVDDDGGDSFAYVTFNEELKAGRQEAKLVVFGKLIRDEQARSPFRLRDLEGFLLKEDTSPDRELMRAIEGTAHTTKRYNEADFSDQEWQSEEKDRHLKEHQKDIERLNAAER